MSYHSNFAHGIMFHRFHDGSSDVVGQGSISDDMFEKIINYIGIENIISPDVWLKKIKNNTLSKHDVCLTFDDGLKSQVHIALPVLKKYNLKAFFFIHSLTFFNKIDYNEVFNMLINTKFEQLSDFLDEFLLLNNLDISYFDNESYRKYEKDLIAKFKFYTENDIKYRYLRNTLSEEGVFINMVKNVFDNNNISIKKESKNIWLNEDDINALTKDGHTLGLHSYSHNINFSRLSAENQASEYSNNKNHLETLVDYQIESMSHPLGSYNHDSLSILKKMNICCGFRSDNTIPEGYGSINPTSLEIARVDASDLSKNLRD